MTNKIKNANTRIAELDVLRGIAALLVVLFHYTTHYNNIYNNNLKEMPFQLTIGKYGVLLFFMVSGFVILMTLDKTKRPLDFIVSRFSRLYPAFWISVCLTFIIVTTSSLTDRKVTFSQALLNLTMVPSLLSIPSVDAVYWTLIIELMFYFIMFMVYMFKLITKIEIVALFWLLFQSTILILDLSNFIHVREGVRFLLLVQYAHFFIAGMIFYRCYYNRINWPRMLILSFCCINQLLMGSLETDVFTMCIFVLFILFSKGYLKRIAVKPIVFFGTISYPLYLTHQNIGYAILTYFGKTSISYTFALSLTLICAVLIATIITFTVELPSRSGIRNWYNRYKNTQKEISTFI